jgi:hypothetical protein
MLDKSDQVKEMINASFLRDDLKEVYYESYVRKLERLRY